MQNNAGNTGIARRGHEYIDERNTITTCIRRLGREHVNDQEIP